MIYALGAFDGFHLGHQSLLDRARERGNNGCGWGVMTFENHPRSLFSDNFKTLFTTEERDLIGAYLGVRHMVKLPFDRMLANMSPESFADFLAGRGSISGFVVGANFRFGRARTGTPEILAEICAGRGWSLDLMPQLLLDGEIVSSTAVRESLLRGQVGRAARFLGYPFVISGKVIKGDGRGRTLGFATANLAVNNRKIYPARGSYAGFTFIGGKWFPVALNIGFNPTFDLARRLRCEAHIIGFSGDIYDRDIYVFVFAKNRDEIRFENENALKLRLEHDVRDIGGVAGEYLRRNGKFFAGISVLFDTH